MATNNTAEAEQPQKQHIDPYNVAGEVDAQGQVKAIDYDRLIQEFGVQPLTDEVNIQCQAPLKDWGDLLTVISFPMDM